MEKRVVVRPDRSGQYTILETCDFGLYNECRKHRLVERGNDCIDFERFLFHCRLLCPDPEEHEGKRKSKL